MADRILKSSISIFEPFNDVRNNRSLARDNPILNYEEALLIFNYVTSSVKRLTPSLIQPPPPNQLRQTDFTYLR